MSGIDTARELIELGLDPPPSRDSGALRRAFRRIVLRTGRAQASHQQRINRELLSMLAELCDQQAQASRGFEELRAWLEETQRDTAAGAQGVRDLQRWNHQLAEIAANLQRRLEPVERHLAASRALPGMTDLELERTDAGSAGVALGYVDRAPESDPHSAYLVFENTFRGSEDLIRRRQTVYVSLLRRHEPVLDVGCGRGELLELLRDAHIEARGIDLDAAMVDRCRAKGLDQVEQGDAVSHLAQLEDASLGAVVALQVIEHLPYRELLAFMREAHRTLKPGGRLIVETVNPHAPQALKTFWVDLSHCHPVFPEVTLALCRTVGFPKAFVFHPGGTGDAERDRFEIGDYAVLAERAASDDAAPQDSSPEASRLGDTGQ